jgi:hypothetical protein
VDEASESGVGVFEGVDVEFGILSDASRMDWVGYRAKNRVNRGGRARANLRYDV